MEKIRKPLGNPYLYAMAAQKMQQKQQDADSTLRYYKPEITSGVRTIGKVVFILGSVWGGSLLYKRWRRQQLMKKAGTVPEVRAAMDIYDCFPAGLKEGQGSLLHPFGFIRDIANQVALVWSSTDTSRLMEVAKRMKQQNMDVKKVFTVFYQVYGEQLMPLLQKGLKQKELDSFANYTVSSSGSETPKPAGNLYAVANVAVRVRSAPVDPPDDPWHKKNIIGVAKPGQPIGVTTGEETRDEKANMIFVEIKPFYQDKYKLVYAWKGGLEFMSKADAEKRMQAGGAGPFIIK